MNINLHFVISLIKSATRIMGYFALLRGDYSGALWLLWAEFLGVIEELPEVFKKS